jgi:hypothetical protein
MVDCKRLHCILRGNVARVCCKRSGNTVAFTEMFGWEVVCMPGVQSLTERTREFAQLCGKLAEICRKTVALTVTQNLQQSSNKTNTDAMLT